MRKEIDWSFYVKIVISGIFLLFVLFILLFSGKIAFKSAEEEQIIAPKKTNFKRPLRLKLIILNTISLFFLLMSIQEYRLNEFMSPQGVDPDKIPPSCRTQQQMYYWVILLCCILLVMYNFVIHYWVLLKASSSNVIHDKKSSKSSSYVDSINTAVENLKVKNGGFVVENYPYVVEYVFSVFLSIFSITIYTMFVLINYNILESRIFKPCFHPQNTARFYDPFVEER